VNGNSPSNGELLSVWERAVGRDGADRALSLLGAASPGRSIRDLGAESIGRRDGLLFAFRERLFGARFDCVTECPRCRRSLEFALVSDDLRAEGAPDEAVLSLSTDRHSIRFRVPDSSDLIAVERECSNTEEAVQALLERCVVEAFEDGERMPPSEIPPEVLDLIDAAMQAKDPQADIEVSLSCPSCEESWTEAFDIAGYLWQELDAWARRVVRDVHTLASAYAWRETDILAMSAARRVAYLDLIRE
jgi:hypothetical protein